MARRTWILVLCLLLIAWPCSAQDAGHGQDVHAGMDGVPSEQAMDHDAEPATVIDNENMASDDVPMDHTDMDAADMGTEDPNADHDMADMEDMDGNAPEHVHPVADPEDTVVGVDEHLGEYIPLDLVFTLSDGTSAPLSELIHGPTIIAPVYYTCPSACNLLQSALANVLPDVGLTPGEEYTVLSVSFDPADTPDIARRKKTDYLTAMSTGMDTPFPEDAWLFLTAENGEEAVLMDALGFRYKQEGNAFLHPVIIVAVAPDGKIVRYLYGQGFLPFDIAMAATEAAEGHVGLSVKRMISYCFTYDPESKQYAFNFMRVSGAAVLLGMGIFFLALLLAGKKKKKA